MPARRGACRSPAGIQTATFSPIPTRAPRCAARLAPMVQPTAQIWGSIPYTAGSDEAGTDSFTLDVSDGHGGSASAVPVPVRVIGAAENTAPTCFGGSLSVAHNTPLVLPAAPCSDAEGDPVTVSVTDSPDHGVLSAPNADGQRTYTPTTGYSGPDYFEYQASDGIATSPTYRVNLTVAAPTPGNNLRCLRRLLVRDGRQHAGDYGRQRLYRSRRRRLQRPPRHAACAWHVEPERRGHGRLHARQRVHRHGHLHLPGDRRARR